MKRMDAHTRSIRNALTLLPLVCSLGCAAGIAQPAGSAGPGDSKRSLSYGELPARLCLDLLPGEAEALRNGKRRLLLSLQHSQHVRRYSPSFSVTLVEPVSAFGETIGHIAMHPDQRSGSPTPDAQRFSFDLSPHLGRITTPAADAAPARICVEVAIDDGDPDVARLAGQGLTAEIQLSASD